MRFLCLLFLVLNLPMAHGRPVLELMDLQTHMTMSFPYPMFGSSLREATDKEIAELKYKHQFTNVIFKNLIAKNSGARILINGALAFEYAKDKEKIKQIILEQIKAVNAFAAAHADEFVVATSAREVRKLIAQTNKTIILHSIEGGNQLIHSQDDAHFWASQGVAFITLIHLLDDEYGGAAHNPDFIGKILNLKGTMKKVFHPSKRRGLTKRGRNAIRWLARAGVMTDLSHMSPESVSDSLKVFGELKLPPLVTHSLFAPIHDNDRALTRQQLFEVYRLGGLFSLPISGTSVMPDDPEENFLNFIATDKICPGSVDTYRVVFEFTHKAILDHFTAKTFSALSEEEKINYSMGWQSDFNGWLNHSRPRYGKSGCWPSPSRAHLSEIETKGLAHPGLLSQYWQLLEKEGMNVSSLKYSSEKFLRMWESFEAYKRSHLTK